MANETKSPIDPEGQALVSSLTRLGEQSEAAYNTVQAVRKMAGDEIISEIRVMRVTVDSDLKAQNARIEAQGAELKSDIKAHHADIKTEIRAQKAEIRAQKVEIKALRWMLGVLIALFSILVALGFFTFVRDRPVERVTQVPAVMPQELVRPVAPLQRRQDRPSAFLRRILRAMERVDPLISRDSVRTRNTAGRLLIAVGEPVTGSSRSI